jgi:hypothetical protein
MYSAAAAAAQMNIWIEKGHTGQRSPGEMNPFQLHHLHISHLFRGSHVSPAMIWSQEREGEDPWMKALGYSTHRISYII